MEQEAADCDGPARDSEKGLREFESERNRADLNFLEGLRGTHKNDAVLNILINRACTVDGINGVLNDVEKYFDSDLGRVASFFGMKFGFRVRDWSDCRSQITSMAASMDIELDGKTSVGGVLAHMRRVQSAPPPGQQDRLRERANEVVRPKSRKKRQK